MCVRWEEKPAIPISLRLVIRGEYAIKRGDEERIR